MPPYGPRATRPVLLVLLLLLGSAGLPEGALYGQGANVAAAPEIQLTDEQLGAFVEAFVRIGDIRDELQKQFARAHAPKARQEIRAAADQQIAAVLAELDLSAEEFSETNRAIGVDAELRARFELLLEGRVPG